MSRDVPPEIVIPAGSKHPAKEVYGFGAALAAWAVLAAVLYLSHWAGNSWGRWLLMLLFVPAVWFFYLIILVQAALWLAMIPTRWFKLGRSSYDRFACGLVLAGFGVVSFQLLREMNPTAHFLGWLWWAGLTFCFLVHWVGKTAPEGATPHFEYKIR